MPAADPFASVATILFDVGNTLHHVDHAFIAQTIAAHADAVSAQAVAHAECAAKRAVDAAFRDRDGGNDSTRQVRYFDTILATLGVPAAAAQAIVREIEAENLRSGLWRVMHEPTPRLLDTLRRRGFNLGVVSNADGRVAAALAATGIADYFESIIDSHIVGVEKPDAAIFKLALQQCNAVAEHTVFVGDLYEIDVRGARNAGLLPVLLDPLQYYDTPDCPRIAELAELLQLLPPVVRRP